MSLSQRIGLFGGAFDPPHLAHQALAQAFIEQNKLSLLYVVPTGHAWHKVRSLSDVRHRIAMARLAFQGIPGVLVDDMEIRREGPSYTVETLEALHQSHPQADLFLLVGADQASSFTQWHQWERVLALATLVVVPRAVFNPIQADSDEWHNLPKERVIHISMPLMPISSSAVRDSYALGQPESEWLNPLVADYVQQNQLYLEPYDRSC